MKRKRYSNELKTKVALAAIKGNQTANEIASEYGVHVAQVIRFKCMKVDDLGGDATGVIGWCDSNFVCTCEV